MNLVVFLVARLADLERSVYEWDSDARAQVAVVRTGPEPGYTTAAIAHPGGPWVADGREVTDARHVHVLYDPARVLRRVRATLALLDTLDRNPFDVPAFDDGPLVIVARHLAVEFSDHPDYDPRWRP